jgi:CPA1 family monovalent cation:H+ antiporter
MEYLVIALLYVGAVLVSSVLDQFLRGVSLPLVQMAVGVAIYFFADLPIDVTINSELFLVMFIAPLLFDESRNISNRILWDNRNTVLSLAIALVVVSVLVVGFVLHWLVPSISLAAAFALGAALGPTDAVAVASLGKTVKLGSRQKASLLGEALLNDASGIVSFQFAIAAAVTGSFSLADASWTFVVEFVGGIILGLFLGAIAFFIMQRMRRAGVESATVHVCFELFLPFFVYLVATRFHVSGILAVVAAGLLISYIPQRMTVRSRSFSTFSTRLNIASESVWHLFSFVLNGVIFVNLGIVLSSTLAPALQENSADLFWIFSLVLILTAVIVGVRFLWILCADLLSDNPETGKRMKLGGPAIRNALVTTLCGPKGAVSLSIASTIPFTVASGAVFPQRDLLLFLVCGVIVVTLLLANFVVPLIAPKSETDDDDELDPEYEIEMIQNVISGLKRRQTVENKQATGRVMRMYHRRLTAARRRSVSGRQLRFLRQEVLLHQRDFIKEAIAHDEVDKRLGTTYLKRVDRMLKLLTRKKTLLTSNRQTQPLAGSTSTMRKIQDQVTSTNETRKKLEFKIDVERVAVDYLELASHEPDDARVQAALALLGEHKALLSALRAQLRALDNAQGIIASVPETAGQHSIVRTDTGSLHLEPTTDPDDLPGLADVQAEGLRLELDEIQEMYESGKISQSLAREMREEIYLLQMGLSD